MYYNLKILAQKHRTTLLSFIESEQERESLPALEALGVEARAVVRRPSTSRHLLVPRPTEHDEYCCREMTQLVQEAFSRKQFDVVQAEFLQMGQHVPMQCRSLKILTEHEIQFANCYANFKTEDHPFLKAKKFYDWMVQLNYEVRMCHKFDRVVCMTEEDLHLLMQFVPSTKVRKIPIGVDSQFFRSVYSAAMNPESKKVLFVGNYRHTPNREAVYHFAEDILPRIHEAVPEAEFCIVGANVDLLDSTRLSGKSNVRVVGYVKDVRNYYQEAAVFVASIRTGNGMRVKLLEAFSMGMAVVASPLARSGFAANNGEHVLVASNPAHFAAHTIRLLKEPSLRTTLGTNARKMIEEHYDWRVISQQFLDLVEDRHV